MADQRPAKRQKAVHPIDTANQRTDEEFLKEYMRPSTGWQIWHHPSTKEEHILRFARPSNLTSSDLEACYRLVEETSRPDYEASTVGWSEEAKRAEMKSADLKYVLLEGKDHKTREGDEDLSGQEKTPGRLRGFVSMMPTFEEGEAVVYCYEIHVKPYLQGFVPLTMLIYPKTLILPTQTDTYSFFPRTGIAQLLMSYVTNTARNIPSVGKTMLTCFTSNTRGRRFYERLGFEHFFKYSISTPHVATRPTIASSVQMTWWYMILSCPFVPALASGFFSLANLCEESPQEAVSLHNFTTANAPQLPTVTASHQSSPRMTDQASHAHPQAQSREWHNGLMTCTPIGDCCLGTWCPCILYGRTVHRERDPTLANYETTNDDCKRMAHLQFWTGCVENNSYVQSQRTELREKYGIPGATRNDFWATFCCLPCAQIQLDKEVELREADRINKEGYRRQDDMTVPDDGAAQTRNAAPTAPVMEELAPQPAAPPVAAGV
ncbi:hypothetical protein NLU13_8110 [Sarocladium strictum]|uniref:N-alpha-acetyltransferase 40 n=1 Tax=Sarocladium strictum TaxID=5046 RepID=A0AA39GBD1_SARSR|nr:hypothetical protein NLU13_8110 [Sarocladium strictum]